MNPARLTLILLAITALSVPRALAITADELAQFLGVYSWTVTIDLPPETFRVEIYEVRDGKVEDLYLRLGDSPRTQLGKVMTILIGPRDGHYRVTASVASGGSVGAVTKVPLLPQTFATGMPKPIAEGDHIFFGQPRTSGESANPNDPRGYTRAFLLRISKRIAGAAVAESADALAAAEEQRALHCLANAKIIATACRLFAVDNDGRFPTTIDELEPDYVAGRKYFTSPLAPEAVEAGYELLGGKDTDRPDSVLVRGRFTTRDGRRSVVYVNTWGALEWR